MPEEPLPLYDEDESILSQTHRDIRQPGNNSGPKITKEYKVTGKEKFD